MSASSNLYSKLKILVAKLYKAEKLYCSMRRVQGSNIVQANSSRSSANSKVQQLKTNMAKINSSGSLDSYSSDALASPVYQNNISSQNLIEHSNDVRSQEWYRVHHYFRIKLNNIVAEGNTNSITDKVNDLWMEFLAEFEIAELDLQECTESAKESLAKEEYSYLFKLSSELIRRKAKLQALKVIHDELNSLVSANGMRTKNNYASLNEALQYSTQQYSERLHAIAIGSSLEHGNMVGNVIPLRRNSAS